MGYFLVSTRSLSLSLTYLSFDVLNSRSLKFLAKLVEALEPAHINDEAALAQRLLDEERHLRHETEIALSIFLHQVSDGRSLRLLRNYELKKLPAHVLTNG